MSDEQRTIPVCACRKPDPATGLPLPLCYGCGRLVVPDAMASRKRVEVRARLGADITCDDCGDSMMVGEHGRGVCVGPAEMRRADVPGWARGEAEIKGGMK